MHNKWNEYCKRYSSINHVTGHHKTPYALSGISGRLIWALLWACLKRRPIQSFLSKSCLCVRRPKIFLWHPAMLQVLSVVSTYNIYPYIFRLISYNLDHTNAHMPYLIPIKINFFRSSHASIYKYMKIEWFVIRWQEIWRWIIPIE